MAQQLFLSKPQINLYEYFGVEVFFLSSDFQPLVVYGGFQSRKSKIIIQQNGVEYTWFFYDNGWILRNYQSQKTYLPGKRPYRYRALRRPYPHQNFSPAGAGDPAQRQ
jgi:hypothetical protein